MKRKIQWIIINCLFSSAVYFGFFQQVEGAVRISIFATWVLLFLTFGMLTESGLKTLKEKGRAIPAWVDVPYDVAIICIFVWFGAYWTAGAYTFHTILYNGAIQQPKESAK